MINKLGGKRKSTTTCHLSKRREHLDADTSISGAQSRTLESCSIHSSSIAIHTINSPYLRRGHRVKRWGLRGRALPGVTLLVMDIELWKAKNTADTQSDSLIKDLRLMPCLPARTYQADHSLPCLTQHSQQNCRRTLPAQLCKISRKSPGTQVNRKGLIKRQGSCFPMSACRFYKLVTVVLHFSRAWNHVTIMSSIEELQDNSASLKGTLI